MPNAPAALPRRDPRSPPAPVEGRAGGAGDGAVEGVLGSGMTEAISSVPRALPDPPKGSLCRVAVAGSPAGNGPLLYESDD